MSDQIQDAEQEERREAVRDLQQWRPRRAGPAGGARVRGPAGRQGTGGLPRPSSSACAPRSPTSTTRSTRSSPRATAWPCAGTGREPTAVRSARFRRRARRSPTRAAGIFRFQDDKVVAAGLETDRLGSCSRSAPCPRTSASGPRPGSPAQAGAAAPVRPRTKKESRAVEFVDSEAGRSSLQQKLTNQTTALPQTTRRPP